MKRRERQQLECDLGRGILAAVQMAAEEFFASLPDSIFERLVERIKGSVEFRELPPRARGRRQ